MKIKKKWKLYSYRIKENRIWNTDKCKMSKKKKEAVNNMNHILVIG